LQQPTEPADGAGRRERWQLGTERAPDMNGRGDSFMLWRHDVLVCSNLARMGVGKAREANLAVARKRPPTEKRNPATGGGVSDVWGQSKNLL